MKKMAPGYQPAILVFVALFLLGGCAIRPQVKVPLASIEGIPGHFGVGRIIHLETGKAISFDELIDQLGSADVVFIGEVHDNPEHHLIQVQILQALMSRYGPVTVAMEFFQEPQQSVIDRYMGGDLTEEVFLEDVDWKKTWGFDYHFYRPLVLLTKEKGGRILAINTPRDIVKKVARAGLSGLEPMERDQLAGVIDLGNEKHRTYLRGVYEKHSRKNLKDFDFFYQAQCAWEDTMAENIAAYLKGDRDKMVVFTGNGHIIDKFGIPGRTIKRVPVSVSTILLYPLTKRETISKKAADYVWLTGDYHRKRPMIRPRPQRN